MKKIIKNFKPLAGKHCNSSSIQQVFHYYGCPLSEEIYFKETQIFKDLERQVA